MGVPRFRLHVLVVAAYLMAAVMPLLAPGRSQPQSAVEHAQMMAMAGHAAQMAGMESPDSGARQMLCQQHCLLATAALPAPGQIAQAAVRATDVAVGIDRPVASLAIPPPGPPPKFAVI